MQFTPELLRSLPAELARKHRVLPVAASAAHLTIVMSDPSDLTTIDALTFALNRDLEICVAAQSQLDSFIAQLYGDDASV